MKTSKLRNTEFKDFEGNIIKEVRGGRAWMGTYSDGTLGFCAPCFISNHPQELTPLQREILSGENRDWYPADFYRVEVDIRLVRNKHGQPIVKRNKKRL